MPKLRFLSRVLAFIVFSFVPCFFTVVGVSAVDYTETFDGTLTSPGLWSSSRGYIGYGNQSNISYSVFAKEMYTTPFPYLKSVDIETIFTSTNTLKIYFKNSTTTATQGAGFIVSDNTPDLGNSIPFSNLLFFVWPKPDGSFHLFTSLCPQINPSCNVGSQIQNGVYILPNDQGWHELSIKRVISHYEIFLDTNLVFKSIDTNRIISSIGIGNPENTLGAQVWPSILVNYVTIDSTYSNPIHTFPYLSQLDPLWAGNEYDTASEWAAGTDTIGRWGCALTSAAMVLQQHQVKFPSGDTVTPANLNSWLKVESDGYVGPGLVNWLAVARLAHQSQLAGQAPKSLEFSIGAYDAGDVSTFIADNPVILSETGHFIIAHGEDGTNWKVADPVDPARTLTSKTGFGNAYYYTPSSTNLGYILLVTDPGVNVTLPESIQVSETLNPEDGGIGVSKKLIYLPKPATGNYPIIVTGDEGSEVMAYLYDVDGTVSQQTLTLAGVTEAQFVIHYSADGASEVELDTAPILAYLKSLRVPKSPSNGVFQAIYSRFVEYLGYMEQGMSGSYFADLTKYVNKQSPRVITPTTRDAVINYIELVQSN